MQLFQNSLGAYLNYASLRRSAYGVDFHYNYVFL